MSGSGISWAICKSALRSRQVTKPAPHCSVFTGRMPFLPPNQQRQSATEITLNVLCARHVPVHSQAPPLVRCTPRCSSRQLYSEDLRAAAAMQSHSCRLQSVTFTATGGDLRKIQPVCFEIGPCILDILEFKHSFRQCFNCKIEI